MLLVLSLCAHDMSVMWHIQIREWSIFNNGGGGVGFGGFSHEHTDIFFLPPPLWTIVTCGLFCRKGVTFFAPSPSRGVKHFLPTPNPPISPPPPLLTNDHSLRVQIWCISWVGDIRYEHSWIMTNLRECINPTEYRTNGTHYLWRPEIVTPSWCSTEWLMPTCPNCTSCVVCLSPEVCYIRGPFVRKRDLGTRSVSEVDFCNHRSVGCTPWHCVRDEHPFILG